MAQPAKPTSGPQPKGPNPMLVDPGLTFREAVELLTPRWIRRLSRKGRSSR